MHGDTAVLSATDVGQCHKQRYRVSAVKPLATQGRAMHHVGVI